MAFLGQEFNVDALPVSETSFEPLTPGWYDATISDAQVKPTKDGSGSYINVKYSITGPTYQGRVVFGMLNLTNKNPKAEEIGRQNLGELMRAIGLARVTDSDQLIGGRCSIKLAVREAQNGYEAQNEVKGWKASAGSAAPAMRPAAAPAPQATASAAPPWAKR